MQPPALDSFSRLSLRLILAAIRSGTGGPPLQQGQLLGNGTPDLASISEHWFTTDL